MLDLALGVAKTASFTTMLIQTVTFVLRTEEDNSKSDLLAKYNSSADSFFGNGEGK